MRHLVFLALLVLAYFTANYMYAAVVKPMWREGVIPGREFEYEAIAGLYLVTIPSIIAIALSVPMGVVADKVGKVKTILFSGLLMGVGLVMVGASTSFLLLSVAFTLFAVGMQGVYPALMGSIADTVPVSKRGLGYAVYYASTVVGYPLGLVTGLLLSWRLGYTFLGALVIALTIAAVAALSRAYRRLRVEAGGVSEYRASGVLKSIASPAVVALLVLIFFWGMPWGAITRYAVNFLEDAWGVGRAVAATILTLASISIIAGHVAGGVLADRRVRAGDVLGRVKVSLLGVAVGIAVMLSFVLYPYPYGDESLASLLPPAALALLGMMFTTLSYPNISSVLSEVVRREYRATVFAVFNILNSLGWAVGPTLYGALKAFLVESLGYSIPLASKVSIATVVLLWLVPLAVWVLMLGLYPKSRVEEG
ncbi:MFS transporter [Thermogladius sp. KZ2Tp1]|uniref:MFS transporter n=1 Tax=Thermogladius sp. KZ2Tp1 TaxID=3136289 RepID=UPI003DA9AB9B